MKQEIHAHLTSLKELRQTSLEKTPHGKTPHGKTPHKAQGLFIVSNDNGLHTRPSTELVKCATRFKSEVFLFYQDNVVNAKSLLGILMLAATRGSRIAIVAEGEDADQAVEKIVELAKNKFNIKY